MIYRMIYRMNTELKMIYRTAIKIGMQCRDGKKNHFVK